MFYDQYVITQCDIQQELHYNPDTGIFTRTRNQSQVIKGDVAGYSRRGYTCIRMLGKKYYAHNLAWLYMTGSLPSLTVDHIDGDGLNNRWSNLRLATPSQNSMNAKLSKSNTSGYKGVSWCNTRKRWCASVYANGKTIKLGNFKDVHDAGLAAQNGRKKYFGEFNRE